MESLIALMTDFGVADIYVGVMKGVMLGIHPQARFIDITHAIQPQNVRQAAFALANAYRYFPAGTIFLVVVDPGVGSARRPIIARVGDFTFVAPDNGVLSYALRDADDVQIYEATNEGLRLSQVSSTFHGRDVFAPAAAHLANGVAPDTFGPPVSDPVLLPAPEFNISGRHVVGEVVHIDHFGNVVTSIGYLRWVTPERLTLIPRIGDDSATHRPIPAPSASVTAGQAQIAGICHNYSDAPRGDLLAMVGSNGYLEIAVNQGNAAARLDVSIGDRVEVEIG
jgi:S-adenosyl-L-methionine hydrolase (adenosine-forming)